MMGAADSRCGGRSLQFLGVRVYDGGQETVGVGKRGSCEHQLEPKH